jgi:hypothetical protein
MLYEYRFGYVVFGDVRFECLRADSSGRSLFTKLCHKVNRSFLIMSLKIEGQALKAGEFDS